MRTSKLNLKKEIKELKRVIFRKCLDCVCCQPSEILKCQIITCPLWKWRPNRLRGLYSLAKDLKRRTHDFYS